MFVSPNMQKLYKVVDEGKMRRKNNIDSELVW